MGGRPAADVRISEGLGGRSSDRADCPLAAPDASGLPHASDARNRKAPARLAGIARLAASSPPAATRRKSSRLLKKLGGG